MALAAVDIYLSSRVIISVPLVSLLLCVAAGTQKIIPVIIKYKIDRLSSSPDSSRCRVRVCLQDSGLYVIRRGGPLRGCNFEIPRNFSETNFNLRPRQLASQPISFQQSIYASFFCCAHSYSSDIPLVPDPVIHGLVVIDD